MVNRDERHTEGVNPATARAGAREAPVQPDRFDAGRRAAQSRATVGEHVRPDLPLKHLVPMLVSGLVFQACASGRFAFAGAAWLCLVSLATLARTTSLPWFLSTSFAVVWLGRLIGWHGQLTDGAGAVVSGTLAEDGLRANVVDGGAVVVASAVAAVLTVLCLLCHRIVMRELPAAGPQALPAAVVVVEWCAGHFGLSCAPLLPLSSTQAGDGWWWRCVDVIGPLGISFGVAWAQGVFAGFGEAWIAEDPHPQKVRERGQRIAANLCFWSVLVVGHVGARFFGDDDAFVDDGRGDLVFGVCAACLVVSVVAALVVRLRRNA